MLESDKLEYILAGKMSQWVKWFAVKADTLSSIPSTHVVEGDKLGPCELFSDFHMCTLVHVTPHTL